MFAELSLPEVVQQSLTHALNEVEARFTAELVSDLPSVNELVTHVEQYRGKMLRPTLVLSSALACAPLDAEPQQQILPAHRVIATVVEMVHMATLVHDDVLDEADMRRRGTTVNRLKGNEAAVMLGDYLISHAYHLCSSLPSSLPGRLIAATTNTVCEGELLQLANRDNLELDEGTYFEIIRRKTGCLTAICCKLAALLHECPASIVDACENFGEKLGVAFQVVDDLLDLTGATQTVGKSLGRDLQKTKLTLPLIHHLRMTHTAKRQTLLHLLDQLSQLETDEATLLKIRPQVRQLLEQTDSIGYAQHAAQTLIQQAQAELQHLSPSPARELLSSLAQTVLTRKF